MSSSPHRTSKRRTSPDGMVRTFRRERANVRLRPYEVLFEGDRWSPATRELAEELIEGRWHPTEQRAVEMCPPVAWDDVVADDRSLHFHLHSWTPLGTSLSAFDRTRHARYLRAALALALDWVRRYPSLEDASPFAWYDMAVGVRACRLAYLLDAATRAPFVDDEVVADLVRSVLLHREALAREGFFPAHSNHGFYVAAGEAALALRFPELPGMQESRDRARARLDRLIHDQFTAEGVHREHSPGYQWMVLDTLEGLMAADLLRAEDHQASLDRIQDATAWFVLPDGHLAMFGDTDRHSMTGCDWPHVRSDALRFVLSRGAEGRPPVDLFRAFPASGYVVFRSEWPRGPEDFSDPSYLAQTCAFHSRTHKHADDLSFIWYDRGREILVDAGRYGYRGRTPPGSSLWNDGFWYADPNRIYVESTRAHNTVEVDGRNFPRRGVEPYGSALARWGESAGLFYSESAARHWESLSHRRVLLLRPGDWLLVFDWLVDEESAPHRFVQRFHFAPELEIEGTVDGAATLAAPTWTEPLHMVSLVPAELVAPARGQKSPELLGWISRRAGGMLPIHTTGFSSEGRPSQLFATLFAFGDAAPQPLADPLPRDPEENHFRMRWRQRGQTHTVSFQRSTCDRLALDYRVGIPPGDGR